MNDLKLPPIDYAAIAPMLILFGAACVGRARRGVRCRGAARHAGAARAGAGRRWSRALVADRAADRQDGRRRASPRAARSPIDGPTLFLQGAIIVLGLVALLLIGERTLEHGGPFVAQAAVTVGSDADRRQAAREPGATEVYPLALFALGGMMLFVAANDLLTMFVALEVFSLPLYLLCALARRRRLLVAGGGAQVLPARRVRLGVLPVRHRAGLRLRRRRRLRRDPRRGAASSPNRRGAAATSASR